MRDLLESLDQISQQELEERVTYATLAKLSGIKDPNKIFPGQKITLPGGGSYTVKSGDTLSGIAQDYRLKKIGQPKKDKLDDPKTNVPKVVPTKPEPNKQGPDGQYDGDDLGNVPTKPKATTVKPVRPNVDMKDMLNRFDKLNTDDYLLDPASIQKPPKYNKIPADKAPDAKPSFVTKAKDALGYDKSYTKKAVDALGYDKSYTKKGVDSLYRTITNLFK